MFLINKREKIKNRNENKIYISREKNKRNFNCDNFFVYFNFKKYCNFNRKKYKTKNE